MERNLACRAKMASQPCTFPSSWDPTQPAKRRKTTFMEETDKQAAASIPVEFQSNLKESILRQLNASQPAQRQNQLALDHILSRVPYRSMLENLFHGSTENIPDLPILGRAFEESFMRQPLAGEQACAMGDQCECTRISRSAPFTAVELRLQGDPDPPQMCVLCSRAATQKMFYDMCYLGREVKGVIQRYGNIFGVPGEYSPECMLAAPRSTGLSCMPLPCMSHQRNKYSVEVNGGVKSLKQQRVGMEDFQSPSGQGAV